MSDLFSKRLDLFHDDLNEFLILFQNTVPVLREELTCIQNGDIPALNDCLNAIQALTLRTKGFDHLISEALTDLGIEAATMTETIQKLPEEHRLRFYSILGQFEMTFKEISFYREECRILLQAKLFSINRTLTVLNAQTDMTVYSPDAVGHRTSTTAKSFEQTI